MRRCGGGAWLAVRTASVSQCATKPITLRVHLRVGNILYRATLVAHGAPAPAVKPTLAPRPPVTLTTTTIKEEDVRRSRSSHPPRG